MNNVIEISVSRDHGANEEFKAAWFFPLWELSLVESFHQKSRGKLIEERREENFLIILLLILSL